ncbi:hypothetical protein EVAR_6366_1 [Eumeta japonica]|uniref:Uncharacterized protein n=1 Tax=Eumeta variegata TaxID=151549 RepID=A0A4C1TD99_EUMVA|nr:hypothetical protein EVAR_6366_1 [Eumeta japonica]
MTEMLIGNRWASICGGCRDQTTLMISNPMVDRRVMGAKPTVTLKREPRGYGELLAEIDSDRLCGPVKSAIEVGRSGPRGGGNQWRDGGGVVRRAVASARAPGLFHHARGALSGPERHVNQSSNQNLVRQTTPRCEVAYHLIDRYFRFSGRAVKSPAA